MKNYFNKQQIQDIYDYIIAKRNIGTDWETIKITLNKRYGVQKTVTCYQKLYYRHKNNTKNRQSDNSNITIVELELRVAKLEKQVEDLIHAKTSRNY